MTADDDIQKLEAKLRVLKGDNYSTMGQVVGTTLEVESGEYPVFENHDIEDVRVGLGVETDDGRRIMTQIEPPTTWDLTSELVVILEYLDLEPEEFHTLGNSQAEHELPVTFDNDEETYHLDFERMRDALLENDE